jgi:hypothetical protein
MPSFYLRFSVVLALLVCTPAWCQSAGRPAPPNGGDFAAPSSTVPLKKVPEGVIIVKGAWSSASDSNSPLPEDGTVANSVFSDPYFGITYALPAEWNQKHTGPPPSDSGLYVLAQVVPTGAAREKSRGVMMISAQDMFFTPLPATNARQLVSYSKNHLQDEYKLEMKPTETKIAGQPFIFYAYWSPAAEIHWYILTTQIRCHAVQFVMSSRDTKLLESLVLSMEKMKLPAEANPTSGTGGGSVPVCIKDFANEANVLERVDPVFSTRRFNTVPVRIIIDKEGKVKHIHYLSAFPEQAKAITDALKQWKFRPYEINGKRVEVETGIVFGRGIQQAPVAQDASTTD